MKRNIILMKKMFSVFLMILLIAVTLISLPGITVNAAKVQLSAKQVMLKKGQSYTLKLKNAKKVKWSSSKKSVATVKKGKITAKKTGKTTITAKSGKKCYKCTVTVTNDKNKTLVIYFSATGTTKTVAEKVAKAAGADIVRLVPQKSYTSADLNYNTDCRANREQNNNTNPAIATKIKNIKQYDTILIGYPIWHGKEPGVIRTFLSKTKLTGKNIIPFCTSGGSGISGSIPHIKKLAKGATVKSGKDLTDTSDKGIKEWVTGSMADTDVQETSETVSDKKAEATSETTSDTKSETTLETTSDTKSEATLETSSDKKNETTSENIADTKSETTPEATPGTEAPSQTSKEEQPTNRIIVAYFSQTGTTKKIAETIAGITGAELYEISAKVPYTSDDLNYNDNSTRATVEQNDTSVRPEIGGENLSLENCRTLYIGYPIWWGQAPRIMDTFVERYDFTGITVIPFCTSASSSMGNSAVRLSTLAGKGDWLDGCRFSSGATESDIRTWLETTGVGTK